MPAAKDDLHGFTPDELNFHFTAVSVTQDESEEEMDNIIAASTVDGFTFKQITPADVILAVSHFSSQALGDDGIPQSIIAKSLPITGPLTTIFNKSLSSGIFPGFSRKAHLVPLKKASVPASVSDFRPIALLSFLSKVLEKIVHTQITDFLASQNILDSLQTGFRQYHSTQTALLKLTEDIRAGIDSKKKFLTILLLIDFSKAFDTISPTKLLRKLAKDGFLKDRAPVD